ncbi:hypothetical protein H9L09_05195 [Nocardioides mesophilus]|uniref:Uncharacterized protein n=1 Tax=Nocardioides mesophilus TaxID=433659 RepID=A0A7G9RDX9_9ACTN|nr:hypothetical protein H9L09_05195 [Nocardioides mesophilus]
MDIVTSDDARPDALLSARALVLHDLEITGAANAESVSALEAAVTTRRWWTSQWEEGRTYVAGLVAQDVQDALLDQAGRWPLCHACDELDPHALYIHPELGGPDPTWVCEHSGIAVAPLGGLTR